MKIEINFEKKHLVILSTLLSILVLSVVVAYNTNNPSQFGHSAAEIEGVCRSDGTGCPVISSGVTCGWKNSGGSLSGNNFVLNGGVGACRFLSGSSYEYGTITAGTYYDVIKCFPSGSQSQWQTSFEYYACK